jgi:hypothetical protein
MTTAISDADANALADRTERGFHRLGLLIGVVLALIYVTPIVVGGADPWPGLAAGAPALAFRLAIAYALCRLVGWCIVMPLRSPPHPGARLPYWLADTRIGKKLQPHVAPKVAAVVFLARSYLVVLLFLALLYFHPALALIVLKVCAALAILLGLLILVLVAVHFLRTRPPGYWAHAFRHARPWRRRLLPLTKPERTRKACHEMGLGFAALLGAVFLFGAMAAGPGASLARPVSVFGAIAGIQYALLWTIGWASAGFHPDPRPEYRLRAKLRRRPVGRTAPPPDVSGRRRRRRRWRRRSRLRLLVGVGVRQHRRAQ